MSLTHLDVQHRHAASRKSEPIKAFMPTLALLSREESYIVYLLVHTCGDIIDHRA